MSADRNRSAGGRRADEDVVPYDTQGGGSVPVSGGSTAVGAARPKGAARTAPPRPPRESPAGATSSRPSGQRRRARLALSRVEPWSVFVLSLLLGVFLGIVLVVAVGLLYAFLDRLGVLTSLNEFAVDLQLLDEGETLVSGGQVMGAATVAAVAYVVAVTALATLGAFLYNLCASLTGGIEVVLGERE